MPLEVELDYFAQHVAEWLRHHQGKFALIKGTELRGFYDNSETAFEEGVKVWGDTEFLIREVTEEDRVEYVPALTYGLIDARQ